MGDSEPPTDTSPIPSRVPTPGSEGAHTAGDRVRDLIARLGRPVTVAEVAVEALGIGGCPESVARRLAGDIVAGDYRLAWDGDLIADAGGARDAVALGVTSFCIVDLETTGGAPGSSALTEIRAVRVEGLRVTERFSTLVDPECPVPPHITGITGIDDAMVRGQPVIDVALPAFIAFARDDVLVAHNAPFDLRFLNYERLRLRDGYFTQPWLDTLVLARRLLNGAVPRHDLSTLAAWAGSPVRPAHRALADAEATASVLIALIGLMGAGADTTLDDAMSIGQPASRRGPTDPGESAAAA
ncbi:MAG: PolC-type DNA polymerase III [Actinomycetota bacterium]